MEVLKRYVPCPICRSRVREKDLEKHKRKVHKTNMSKKEEITVSYRYFGVHSTPTPMRRRNHVRSRVG